jgi:ubiquinone/menaquinone biosynthesis C-methylase UbiE
MPKTRRSVVAGSSNRRRLLSVVSLCADDDVDRGEAPQQDARNLPRARQKQDSARQRHPDDRDQGRGRIHYAGGHIVSQVDRERLIEIYRHKAKHYDLTSRLYPAPGYPQRRQRLRAVRALGLRPGDFVIDVACGTGLNFPLIQEAIGPDGRIVGVDLTDAMLARAQERIATNGWRNVCLEQADAAEFEFPTGTDAILSTYAMSQVPECAEVIAHGAAALSGGGRWAVLDLKVPDNTPGWLAQLGTAIVRPFASIDEWTMRRPWEAIRAAMQEELADFSWSELFFGTSFLAAGSRGPGSSGGSTSPSAS